jgi:hypothetical protein
MWIASNQIVGGNGRIMSDIVGLAESCFKNSQEPPKGRRDKKTKRGGFVETDCAVKPVLASV